ncbi:putative flavoprotein [Xylaria bambusicola]|uniref:putative flavoprotein n=1 Tax=Xylaria bambusicola TaxID=326684 RepID=UPI0020082DD4|nr:putative flavoprotein [Xylaria bambusicola]KAI0521866.1 putative flavoprotein [Xylaria bambusicola]
MLAAITNGYESHHTRTSIQKLTASLNDGKIHLLLACSGSVATIKLPNIIQALSKYPSDQLSIRVILTPSASHFLAGQSKEQPTISGISHLPNVDAVDADEWKVPWVRGGGILHIELRRWADLLVIAPLSANTLAKITGGFADSLLTSVVRAWDPWGELDTNANSTNTAVQGSTTVIPMTQEGSIGASGSRRIKKRRIIVAPAMNTAMWRHPITAKQLRVLEEEWGVRNTSIAKTEAHNGSVQPPQEIDQASPDQDEGDGWFEVLRPQPKVLACGDSGDGAMLEWSQIVTVIEERLGLGA